jgi:hypothetical protein
MRRASLEAIVQTLAPEPDTDTTGIFSDGRGTLSEPGPEQMDLTEAFRDLSRPGDIPSMSL